MATEIERKFLVDPAIWRPVVGSGLLLRQGYLSTDLDRVVRVRVAGEGAWITVKGRTLGISRPEFEYAIPPEDASEMLATLCRAVVEKWRYSVAVGSHRWDVDRFIGANEGLIVAEIELGTVDEEFERPSWVRDDVSHDPRYANVNLADRPYPSWGA